MKTLLRCILLSVLLLTLNRPSAAWAQGTAFTYQGRLLDNGIAFTGSAEFQPTLWDAASGGGQVAAHTPASVIVGVTNGLFALPLEFGGTPFATGAERWLQLEVRTSIGAFTLLSPRQQLTAAPYAMTAGNLTGALPASQLTGTLPSDALSGTYSGAVQFTNAVNSFSGSGSGLISLNASRLTSGTVPDARLGANVARSDQVWLLGGNAGTKIGMDFLGTTDSQPLELRVNGSRGWRLEPTLNDAGHSNIVNVVGGSPVNVVGPGVYGATIGGGGAGYYYYTVTGTNRVDANFGTISGGRGNTIQPEAISSTIGGGYHNSIESYASDSTIGGGYHNSIQFDASSSTIDGGVQNTIQPGASTSTIGGGVDNTIQSYAFSSTIGGGENNTIQTNADYSTTGGGHNNTIQADATYSTLGGGAHNTIQTNADFSTLGGGYYNTIQTNASFATVPGGRDNSATNYALAAGRRAKANHTGAFVWADSQDEDFASSMTNQFNVRASGGTRFFGGNNWNLSTSEGDFRIGTDAYRLKVGVALTGGGAGDVWLRPAGGTERLRVKTTGGTVFYSDEAQTSGVQLAAGGGSWTSLSDRNAKENLETVDAQSVLDKVVALPLSTWNYKSQDSVIRHIGPMAQDFKATFGVGESDTGITSIDADGVALAAIQGLNQKLEAKNAALEKEVAELKALVQTLAEKVNWGGR